MFGILNLHKLVYKKLSITILLLPLLSFQYLLADVDIQKISNSQRAQAPKKIYISIATEDDSSLALAYTKDLEDQATVIRGWISDEYTFVSQQIGSPKNFRAQVELMEQEVFFRKTKLPKWTNAIYLDSRIILPLSKNKKINSDKIKKAIRHELTHAVVDTFSRGRCPGWLDEGLAQILEGDAHPALRIALNKWISHSGPISLDLLQNGFTGLKRAMVPAAYAQSYVAAQTLLDSERKFSHYKKLFIYLNSGDSFHSAFQKAFGKSVPQFESALYRTIQYEMKNTTPSQKVYRADGKRVTVEEGKKPLRASLTAHEGARER